MDIIILLTESGLAYDESVLSIAIDKLVSVDARMQHPIDGISHYFVAERAILHAEGLE